MKIIKDGKQYKYSITCTPGPVPILWYNICRFYNRKVILWFSPSYRHRTKTRVEYHSDTKAIKYKKNHMTSVCVMLDKMSIKPSRGQGNPQCLIIMHLWPNHDNFLHNYTSKLHKYNPPSIAQFILEVLELCVVKSCTCFLTLTALSSKGIRWFDGIFPEK